VTAIDVLEIREKRRARNLFLYRNLVPFIRSWVRAFTPDIDSLSTEERRGLIEYVARKLPLFSEELRNRTDITAVEVFGYAWLSTTHRYIRLREDGIRILPVRYEDLNADPVREFKKMFRYVGPPIDRVQSVLPAFDRDSQAGSVLSREEVGRRNVTIDDRQWGLVRDLVRRHPVAGGDLSDESAEVP
jgi:hypothetical protein